MPWFRLRYQDRQIAEAMELIGQERMPAPEEQEEADRRLTALLARKLPSPFYLQGEPREPAAEREPYTIYARKLLQQTWERLRDAGLAGDPGACEETPLSEYGGLLVMSILADCCAGTTRSRVTDRVTVPNREARETLAKAIRDYVGKPAPRPGLPQAATAGDTVLAIDVSVFMAKVLAPQPFAALRCEIVDDRIQMATSIDVRLRQLTPLDELPDPLPVDGGSTDLHEPVRELLKTFARVLLITDDDGLKTLRRDYQISPILQRSGLAVIEAYRQ